MSAIAITGPSGTGKSTSYLPNEAIEIKGLHPRETVVINVSKKDLPMKKANKWFPLFDGFPKGTRQDKIDFIVNQIENKRRQILTDNASRIMTILDALDCCCPQIKNVVIDDSQYLQGLMMMGRIQEAGWQKFNDIAEAGFGPIQKARNLTRKDLLVFFLYHSTENEKTGQTQIKTVGKAVDTYITFDGLFTVNLYTHVEMENGKPIYQFRTQTKGNDTCKSPNQMFDSLYIPNDLGLVRDKYLEYYE